MAGMNEESWMKTPRWYVIRPVARGDNFAEEDLKAVGIEVFKPTFNVYSLIKHTKGQRRVKERLLTPSYLFAKLSGDQFKHVLGDREARRQAAMLQRRPMTCPHVHSIYHPPGCNRPMHASATMVEALRELCAQGAFDQGKRAGDGYLPGERVRITEGPFAGFVARFKDDKAKPGSVRVLLEMLFNEVTATVSEDWIEAA